MEYLNRASLLLHLHLLQHIQHVLKRKRHNKNGKIRGLGGSHHIHGSNKVLFAQYTRGPDFSLDFERGWLLVGINHIQV